MWPFRKPDALVEFGFGFRSARLRWDAVGQPFVRVYGNTYDWLKPGGRTTEGRRWIALTEAAGAVWMSEADQ